MSATLAPPVSSGGAKRSRSALSVPNFRIYFVSAATAQTGSWLLRTAQAWLVLDLTGNPAALALVTVLQALPVTILTLFAGILIDRMQSRRLLVVVQIVISLEMAVMAVLVLTNTIQYWQVLVLATVLGLASAVDFPTRASIISELVEPRLVPNGVALNSALNSAARIIGPGIGGWLIASWGTGVCFAVTTVVYSSTTLGLLVLKSAEFFPKRMARRTAVLSQLVEGLRYSVSTPLLAINILLAGVYGTFAYNWALVLPLFARFALDTGSEGFGALNMAMGFGSMLGAFLLATQVKATLKLLFISALTFGVAMVILARAPNMPVALGLLVCTGILSVLFNATNNTLLQVEAREDIRGRVLSLYMFLMIGSTPVGGAFTGFVADTLDVRVALVVNGVICLAGLAVASVFLYRWQHKEVVPERCE
ncbi:MAG: MFS transporter [Chloroflexi bacterium]|nr:MFS transporter [Chloroflexota bacterium]